MFWNEELPMAYQITSKRSGNKETRRWVEVFVDRVGNVADVTYCDFVNKKGDLIKKHTLFVKWRAS